MDEWFYKAFGEEHGPVSFERLQEMALKNQLSPQDRVRSAEWKEWVAARTVPQLFPKHRVAADGEAVEEIDDSEFHNIELADGDAERELSSLDDLDIQVSDAPTAAARASGRVDAYGSLIVEEAETRLGSLDDLDIQIADAPAAKSSGPTDAYGSPISEAEDEDQWICQTLGHQLGPMSLAELRVMARNGEVGLDDDVRRVNETPWRPARAIDGLFPGFEYTPADESFANEDDFELSKATLISPQKSAGKTSPSRPSRRARPVPAGKAVAESRPSARSRSASKPKAESEPQVLQKWLSDEVPSEPEKPVEAKPAAEEEPAPTPVEQPNPAAAYQARMAELARQQAANRKPAAQAKVQGPSMGERFSGLGEKFKENPKVMGVMVVLLLVLIVKYVPWPFGKGSQAYFDEISQIGSAYKELQAKNPGPSQVDSFKRQVMPQLDALEAELKDSAASSEGPKFQMYSAVGNLKAILEGGGAALGRRPKGPTQTEKLYDHQMATALAFIEGKTPPPPLALPKPASNEP